MHNLGLVDFKNINTLDQGYKWAHEARETINSHLLKGEFQPLVDYKNGGRSLRVVSMSNAIRRSDKAPISAIANAKLSQAMAMDSA